MNKKEITSSLSHLQRLRVGGEPDAEWVRTTREHLLASVRQEARTPSRQSVWAQFQAMGSFFPMVQNPALAYRPMLAGVLAIAVVMGGSVSAVSAAMNSLPGDALYSVKIASERVQVAAAQSDQTKAELGVAFLGRRVDEVQKIIESEDPKAPARVDAAMKKMKEDVGSVKEQLQAVQESAPDAAVSVAKLIDEKSTEFGDSLKQTADQLPPVESQHVKEARALVNDLSVQAVVLLVQAHENGDASVSAEELTQKVEKRITAISNAATLVADHTTSTMSAPFGHDTATQALNALVAAKVLLEQNQFTPALSKVIEGKELVSAAEKIIDATSGAAALTALSSSTSTTTGVRLGGDTGSIGIEPLPPAPGDPAPAPSSTSPPVTGVTTSTSPSSGGELGH